MEVHGVQLILWCNTLTAITTQSSPWNLGIYLSPRATSMLFSGLKRHTTLIQVSAASVISAAVDGWSSPSSCYSLTATTETKADQLAKGNAAPLTGMLRSNCVKVILQKMRESEKKKKNPTKICTPKYWGGSTPELRQGTSSPKQVL